MYPDLKHKWGYRNHYHKKKYYYIYQQKKKQKYDQRLETVIYLCMQLKCGREKNSEANTLAMLFEAHRSLLIEIFLLPIQKLPKMLIMAHMCTSLSIMRLKTCFFWLLSDSRSIEGSVENILQHSVTKINSTWYQYMHLDAYFYYKKFSFCHRVCVWIHVTYTQIVVDVVDVVVGQRRKKEEKHQFFASTNTFGDTSIVFALTNLQWLA